MHRIKYTGQGVTRLVYHPAITLIRDGKGSNNRNGNLVPWPDPFREWMDLVGVTDLTLIYSRIAIHIAYQWETVLLRNGHPLVVWPPGTIFREPSHRDIW